MRGLFFHDTITNKGTDSKVYCQDSTYSKKMMEKDTFFYESMPEEFKPSVDLFNLGGIRFDGLNSSITAHTPGVGEHVARKQGRSTTTHNLHGSEFSDWARPKLTMQGLLESVPIHGNVFLEFSPKRIGDYAHKLYVTGRDNSKAIFKSRFTPWFLFDENILQEGSHEFNEMMSIQETKEENRLVRKYSLTPEQLAFRRYKIMSKGGDLLSFLKEYPEDDESCFESETPLVFTSDLRKKRCLQFEEGIKGHIHSIGCDIGLGIEGGDYSSIIVIDVTSGEQVYGWHDHIDPENFAQVIYDTWLRFPGLVGIETNSIGLATVKAVLKIEDDPPTKDTHFSRFLYAYQKARWGWLTTASNKPSMIFGLRQALRDASEGKPGLKLSYDHLIKELGWFQHLRGGGMGAPSGGDEGERLTDDCVMACAIALAISEYAVQIEKPFSKRFGSPDKDPDPDGDLIWTPARINI